MIIFRTPEFIIPPHLTLQIGLVPPSCFFHQVDLDFEDLPTLWPTSTQGAIGVHINSNEHVGDGIGGGLGPGGDMTAWLVFDAGW